MHITKNWISAALAARKNRIGNEDGNMMVEVALTLPLFMLLFTGIVTFANAYNNELNLTQAVGTGAQYLQQIRTSTSDPCKDTLTAIENAAPNLTGSEINLTLTMDGEKVNKSTCSGDQSYLVEGAPVTVSATYPCVLNIYNMSFVSSCQLSAQVTEYEY